MKAQIRGLVFIAVISLFAAVSVAGPPTVAVYFDEGLTMRSADRLGPGLVTLYIVAENFDAHLTAIEYQIDYPAGVTWVADLDVPTVKIGTTVKGIAQAWAEPIDGFSRVVIAKSTVQWDAGLSGEVTVRPHPTFGFVRATAAPDHRIIEAKGGISYVGKNDRTPSRGSEPVLYGSHPNPFNPVTQITYWLPQRAHVSLNAYDVAGRLVASLVNGMRDMGEHTVEWRADNLPSGVYFYRLDVGDFSERRKVMLLK
jgi:hypothetical protein